MKKKSLEILYKELKDCGNRLVEIADALLESCSSTTVEKQEVKEEPIAAKEPEKTYTLEEVRAILSAKSKAGFREQVKEMINKRGVDNLTKLDPSEYLSLVIEVEELANG